VRRFLVVVLVLVLLALALAYRDLVKPATPPEEAIVEVVPGMGTRAIGALLAQRGIIRSQYVFDLWHLVRGGTLKAGEYQFVQPATLPSVYNRIVRGDVYTRTVTIPEGYNLFDIAQAVEDAQLGVKAAFLAAANQDVALIADLDPVEKETPVAEDRPLVASVLSNRLAKEMPLMTDPTVIYAAMLEKRYRGTIYQSDLKRDSAYNTYRHAGLPPGPICSPGTASLRAAMHPADSHFLYFVADPAAAGHSRFAATLEEHERNVTAYRRGLKDAQGAH
jgi:UPF0755 protein